MSVGEVEKEESLRGRLIVRLSRRKKEPGSSGCPIWEQICRALARSQE